MPPKGKQGTKGQKQILQENVDTLAFYRNMMLAASCLYGAVAYFLFNEIPTLDRVLIAFAAIVYLVAYKFMSSMATPKYGTNNVVLDEGCDLNIEGGIAEHIKDLIILTTVCVVFSTYSSYFWLFWLLVPGRAFQLLWTNILGPYFFEPAPPEEEISEKKQRKMERKMMRRR